jgi:hypothetical protein
MRYSFQGVARDGMGAIIPGATISVFNSPGYTAATVYAASSGGSPVSSVTSSLNGSFIFFVDDSIYTATAQFQIVITKTNYATTTYDNISIIGAAYITTRLLANVGTAVDTSGTITIDWSVAATYYVTLTGKGRTLTFTNMTPGQVYRLVLTQDGGGSETITTYSSPVTWMGGGGVPNLNTTSGKIDVMTFVYGNGILIGDCRNG